MTEIIAQIWALPFWQVMVIAMADDLILLVRAWPFYVGVIVLCVGVWAVDRDIGMGGNGDGKSANQKSSVRGLLADRRLPAPGAELEQGQTTGVQGAADVQG